MHIWAKLTSWHIEDPEDPERTLCGRRLAGTNVVRAAELPMDDKSCETCLRVAEDRKSA